MAQDAANRVRPTKLGHSNIYFIQTQSGHIMVDAGMPDMEDQLDAVFVEAGIDPQSVGLIVLTHGHIDHVGSVAHAHKVTGGKVLCHRAFGADLAQGKPEEAVARSARARELNAQAGSTGFGFDGIRPDLLMDDQFDLAPYGLAGKIIHTPGHSPSSISILLDNGEAVVGDLVREEEPGVIGLGMFYEDEQVLLESLEAVASYEPRIIYLSHGTSIDSRVLKDAIEANR